MTFRIEPIDIASADGETFQGLVDLVNSLNLEAEPRQTPLNVDEALLFFDSPGSIRQRFVARDVSGLIVGHLMHSRADDGSNPETLRVQIGVATLHRRKGLGSQLLAKLVQEAGDLGRDKLTGHVTDTVPAAQGFATALGARAALDMHVNVVKVADLDLDLLRDWAEGGPARAPGYSTTVYEGMPPHGLFDGLAHLYFILERDSPTPEGHEPRVWTSDLVEQMYTHFLRGVDSLMAVATHDETGTPVGISQLIRRHGDPSTWIVTVTMVDPEHRGHALGKWTKAAVNLEALERWPGGVWQETANAFTNDAMLGINRAMGFEHELTVTETELSVADAKAYLARHS